MLISHSHQFVFIHVPKAAGHSVSAALYPHIQVDFKISGWRKYYISWLFKSVSQVTNNKEVNLLHWKLLINAIDFLKRKGVAQIHHLGKQGIGIFHGLMKSFENEDYPKLYSTVLNHDTMMEVLENDPHQVMQGYFKFGFVRHPADWLVSIFFFFRQRPHLKELYERAHQFQDFSEFVDYLYQIRSEGKPDKVMGKLPFKIQTDFLFDTEGQCLVDKIGYLETFQSDFRSIMGQIGIDSEIHHGNKSQHDNFLSYYDEPLWEKMCYIMERDFRLLSYEKSYDAMHQKSAIVS